MSPSELLRKGAAQIRKYGWSQFAAVSCAGGLCMTAAVRAAAGLDPSRFETPESITANGPALRTIFESVWGNGGDMIPFNNHDCESADDAIAALEIAADIAECEGL